MPKKLEKLIKLFKNRKRIRNHFDAVLSDDKIERILTGYNIQSLPDITIKDLFNLYNYDYLKDNVIVKTDFSEGISSVNDYYILGCLARAKKIKKYFEIGTWVGLSAYNVSACLDDKVEIYTLDIPESHPELKLYGIPYEIFGYYSKSKTNIHHLKGDSNSFDFSPYYNQFELIFIDGNHSYESVKNDTGIALKLLKDDSSIIAWHDYKILGEVNKIVIAGILDAIPAQEHIRLYYLNQSNIAIFARAFNFERKYRTKWELPEETFEITMNLK